MEMMVWLEDREVENSFDKLNICKYKWLKNK